MILYKIVFFKFRYVAFLLKFLDVDELS